VADVGLAIERACEAVVDITAMRLVLPHHQKDVAQRRVVWRARTGNSVREREMRPEAFWIDAARIRADSLEGFAAMWEHPGGQRERDYDTRIRA
jgi:hypothetical protein